MHHLAQLGRHIQVARCATIVYAHAYEFMDPLAAHYEEKQRAN